MYGQMYVSICVRYTKCMLYVCMDAWLYGYCVDDIS